MAKQIEFDGRAMSLSAWSKELGVSISTLHGRMKRLSVEEAFGKYLTKEESMGEEHKIVDDMGDEYIQKPLSLHGKINGQKPGPRVTVYNKLRTTLHCSDCVLPAESEGSILKSDLNFAAVAEKVIRVAS